MNAWQEAPSVGESPVLALTFMRFAEMARDLATAVTNPSGYVFEQTVHELLKAALYLSGADVASCRRVRFQQEVELVGEEVWAFGVTPVGKVAEVKHQDDCRPQAKQVEAWSRTGEMNRRTIGRLKHDATPYYKDSAIAHFGWLKSEAIIPLRLIDGKPTAMIVLGHGSPEFFSAERVKVLEKCSGLIDAFYELATFAVDRIEKARLLERVAGVLPQMACAESEIAFARAVCTLLTCGFGFRFDRALYFHMNGHALPAECLMAVGGMSDHWPAKREKLAEALKIRTLAEFIQFVLEHPLPRLIDDSDADPLYLAACRSGNPLWYREGESTTLDNFLRTGKGTDGGSVLRLSHRDVWIARSHQERSEMFFNRNDEFFVFSLQPIKPDTETSPLAFVVADLPYLPWKHQAGPGFPDLEMVSISLKLLAGLWDFRNDSRSYFHILGALPLLRHTGGRVLETVDWIRDQLKVNSVQFPAGVDSDFAKLRELAVDVARAKDIVASLRRSEGQIKPLALPPLLQQFASRMRTRHPEMLASVSIDCPDVMARIHPDALQEILTCLVDNAAVHGSKGGVKVNVNLCVSRHPVPEYGGVSSERLLLTVKNDGLPIPAELANFLFANRVSTHHNGFGSGLSSASQLARAFGGDVLLTSSDPVQFALILELPRLPRD